MNLSSFVAGLRPGREKEEVKKKGGKAILRRAAGSGWARVLPPPTSAGTHPRQTAPGPAAGMTSARGGSWAEGAEGPGRGPGARLCARRPPVLQSEPAPCVTGEAVSDTALPVPRLSSGGVGF